MLQAMQTAFPDTYLGSLLKTGNHPKLIHHSQIPLDDKTLKNYMMEPLLGNKLIYSTKIIAHSNTELKHYLTNGKFRNYLTNENISLVHNTLSSLTPFNVGFIKQVTASRNTIFLHKVRVSNLLPKDAPKLQVSLQQIYSAERSITYFVMIQSAEEDVSELKQMLIYLTTQNKMVFYPWSNFANIEFDQKQTTINDNRRWNFLFKSIVISGFKDNNDDIKMNHIEMGEELEYNNLFPNMTITDYLYQLVHPITNKKLFDYVYPSTMGQQEFIVSTANSGDAENYLKCLIGELAREMSFDAINSEFENPTFAIQQAKNFKWIPFAKGATIVGTTSVKKTNRNFQTKQSRVTHENNHYSTTTMAPVITKYTPVTPTNGTYASIATKSNKNPYWHHMGASTVENISVIDPEVTVLKTQFKPVVDPEIILLKTQFTALQNTVDILKCEIRNTNNETSNNTAAINNISINLDNKLSQMHTQHLADMEISNKNSTDNMMDCFKIWSLKNDKKQKKTG
jgi:hypothetical protein